MSKLTHSKKIARRKRTKHTTLPIFTKKEMKERFTPGKVKKFKRPFTFNFGETRVVVYINKNNSIYDISPRIAFDYLYGTQFNREFVEEVIKNRL